MGVVENPRGWSAWAATGLLLLAACDRPDDAPRPGTTAPLAPRSYREAPELAASVGAGELPAVEDRLPRNPLVVTPAQRLGQYGGTWRMAMVGTAAEPDKWLLLRTLGYENLVRWDPEWRRVVPNLAQSYEVNDDATEITFRLRSGVHWSDGEPFTADDILFWYEDVYLQEELHADSISWLIDRDDLAGVEKLDDHTVRFRFHSGQGLLLRYLAHPLGRVLTQYPRHYLHRFHPRYNPDGIDDLVAAHGAEHWTELFKQQGWPNPRAPTLFAWQLLDEADPEQLVAVRNPYYFKIDPVGRQLPYLDRVTFQLVPDAQGAVDLAVGGQVDMQSRYFDQDADLPRLEEGQESGNYRLLPMVSSAGNRIAISLNLTHRDPVLREIFQDKGFRIGLSHALDRRAIIDHAFRGVGEPYQVAPPPDSPFYHERLGRQYTDHDLDAARTHLDQAGLSRRDAEGYRLRSDGARLSLQLDVWNGAGYREAVPLIQRHWQAVGLDVRVQWLEREAFDERRRRNQHDAVLWVGSGGLGVMVDPRHYFPSSHESSYAVPWAQWYKDPEDPDAEHPPDLTRRQMALYDDAQATSDPDRQHALMREILDLSAEAFYVIGITSPGPGVGVVASDMQNVPPVMPMSWVYPHPAPTNPCQYFRR